jgi:hypothetical protein
MLALEVSVAPLPYSHSNADRIFFQNEAIVQKKCYSFRLYRQRLGCTTHDKTKKSEGKWSCLSKHLI